MAAANSAEFGGHFYIDGRITLPMRRGTWVLTNLFDDPPGNPPPNAGEIQPNTAGANLTLRQRIEMHRTNETCDALNASTLMPAPPVENNNAAVSASSRARPALTSMDSRQPSPLDRHGPVRFG